MRRLPLQRPLLCLVTDRRRLAGDRSDAEGQERVVLQVRAAAAAGISLVQVRERDLGDAALHALVERCVLAARGTACRVLVNDRPDVALAAGADGVHLRADSFAASRARQIAPPSFLVGLSVHDPEAARRAAQEGDLDYLIFGSVFASGSKPADHRAAGLEALERAVRGSGALPVLAIGGIGPGQAIEVARTGAAGIAGIGLFLGLATSEMAVRVRALQQAFDSSTVFP